MVKIAPSLFCADLLNLERDIRKLDAAGMDMLHVDIMDGHFVPNYALNFDIVEKVKCITSVPMNVHLMVENPMDHIPILTSTGVKYASFHAEATNTPIRVARDLRSKGIKAGVALNPSTGIDRLRYILDEIDFVLLLAVEPGFSGQRFLNSTLSKIKLLDNIRNEKGLNFSIEVDGGIDADNGAQCILNGADILVAGALCIFKDGAELDTALKEFSEEMKKISRQQLTR